MKTTELMIGDWVQSEQLVAPARYSGFFRHFPETVSGKPYTRLECLYEGGREGGEVPEDKVMPIPLTPEILVKNAFFLDDDGWYVWNDYTHNPTQHFVAVSFHRGGSVRHIEIKSARCHANYENVRHIHELQHALRLCGLNSLADNFKIK